MRVLRWLAVSWVANAIVLGVAALVLSGVSVNGSAKTLFVSAAVFGVLNTFLKPVMRLLTAPLALLTLGLAWFFVSMMMLWLTVIIVDGFSIDGFWQYVWATVIVWAVNLVVDVWFRHEALGRRKN